MTDLQKLASDLASQFINGSKSCVKDALRNTRSPIEAAKLVLAIAEELGGDRDLRSYLEAL